MLLKLIVFPKLYDKCVSNPHKFMLLTFYDCAWNQRFSQTENIFSRPQFESNVALGDVNVSGVNIEASNLTET